MQKGAIILDVTRLFSRRFHDADTGIDRVERGVFEVLAQDPQTECLLRFGRYYFRLTPASFREVLAHPQRGRWSSYQQLRKRACARGKSALNLHQFQEYWHLGHARHSQKFWQALDAQGIFKRILIHDVIPLDYPEYCRPEQVPIFTQNFKIWTQFADQIITTSQYNQSRILAHKSDITALKTIALAIPPLALAQKKTQNAFVVLGTIEPRKNHLLLLELWQKLFQDMGDAAPLLWIIGARGWGNDAVFEMLDHSPMMGQCVFELGPLSDDAMRDHLSRAKALLFPSFVEGFGLPFYEAILAQKPVIASHIPAFLEAIQTREHAQLLDPKNPDQWHQAITHFQPHQLSLNQNPPASWNEYVNLIK